MSENARVLVYLVEHLLLTALPLVAAMLFAARRRVRSVPLLLAIGLATSGVVAMLAFWAFYADPLLGESFAYLILFGSVALGVWSLWGRSIDPALLRRLATPLALWALGSLFLVFLGFVHGGADAPLAASGSRFSGPLPSDNDIPRFYAEWFFDHGHEGTAPVFPGEWLSSDRPPLQIGYVLAQQPFGWDAASLHYELAGVVLQQLWIVGLWALLLAARLNPLTRALTMLTVLVSDLALLNGFFVWPKLLPAAMLLAAAALVMTPLWDELRRNRWAAAVVGALLALAMLGHGSSVFGIVPLAAVAAFRGLPDWRWIGAAVAAGLFLLVPWSAYQKYDDPPGNRLVKWHIGGVLDVDDRGSLEAIVDSYREIGLGEALHNKGQNLVAIVGGKLAVDHARTAIDQLEAGNPDEALRGLRGILFFYLLPSLGLLLLAPLAMAVGRVRGPPAAAEWSFALYCLAVLAIGAVAWALVMFGDSPGTTVVHQGSYLLPIRGFCGAVAGLRATFPRLAIYWTAVAALLMLAVYVPAMDPLPGTGYSVLAALLAAAGLGGFAAVALRADRGSAAVNTLAR